VVTAVDEIAFEAIADDEINGWLVAAVEETAAAETVAAETVADETVAAEKPVAVAAIR
jgi:hypothetical protein